MSISLNATEVELLSALQTSAVQFLVIGGHAVIFHGYIRPAKDFDLWLYPDEENVARFAKALSHLSSPFTLTPEQLAQMAQPMHQLKIDLLHTEILTSVTGLDFLDASGRALVGYEHGVQYPVLCLADLIMNKRTLAREQDLEDVRKLQALPPPVDELATMVFPSAAYTNPPAP